jgi:hypothetical protein
MLILDRLDPSVVERPFNLDLIADQRRQFGEAEPVDDVKDEHGEHHDREDPVRDSGLLTDRSSGGMGRR